MPPQAIRDSELSIFSFLCITSPPDCRWMSRIILYETPTFHGSSNGARASHLGAVCAWETKQGNQTRLFGYLLRRGRLSDQYLGGPHASQSRDTSFSDHSDGSADRNRRRTRWRQCERRQRGCRGRFAICLS